MGFLQLYLVLENLLRSELFTRRDPNALMNQSTMFFGQEVLRFGLPQYLDSNETAQDLGYHPLSTLV